VEFIPDPMDLPDEEIDIPLDDWAEDPFNNADDFWDDVDIIREYENYE
jgi:hypothetical protein